LRPGGTIAVVDFKLDSTRGPPPEHRLAPDEVLADLRHAGLTASLSPTVLPDQYIVIATHQERCRCDTARGTPELRYGVRHEMDRATSARGLSRCSDHTAEDEPGEHRHGRHGSHGRSRR